MLEQLIVKNYKSLERPNNAGKSNIIDSLRLLRDLAEECVDIVAGSPMLGAERDLYRHRMVKRCSMIL